MEEENLVEVTGIVSNIKRQDRRITFKITCPNMGQTFPAVCDLYCPLQDKDIINALCQYRDGVLSVMRSPFVQPCMDRDSIIQCFIKALRKGFKPALKIYNCVSRLAGGDENVTSFLTNVAQEWWTNHNYESLYMFENCDPDEIKRLLIWWHKERNLRRLYLLGLTKHEINECNSTCDKIYQSCVTNPFVIAPVSLEKCDEILRRLNKKCELDERICGSIVRVIYQKMARNSWTAMPLRMLLKQFPDLTTHMERLKSEYDVVTDYQCAYLSYPHKIEVEVADFIMKLARNNRVSYETPLDEKIECEDGTIIERLSATYNSFVGELSDDQKKAIQGALDHTISIITGGAGCGKSETVGQIVNNLELRGTPYAVCSFTGKAVAVLRAKTRKRNPATIHRLISNSRRDPFAKKSKVEMDLPFVDYEHIIIDEASMVTTSLFYDLIQAYPNIKKITFVGDVNQLEPIGWGALFHQLIHSGTIPTYKLTTNYRVYTVDGERDGVILNANMLIKHVSNFPFSFVETSNFTIDEGPIERVYDIVNSFFRAGLSAENMSVITPYNYVLDPLNSNVQNIFDTGKRFAVDSRGHKWIIGDIVMMKENDNEINVFNGEKGIVTDVNDKSIFVNFLPSGCHEFLLEPTKKKKTYYSQGIVVPSQSNADTVLEGYEDPVDYERTVKKLDHAYAITVDKSQGSEWDFIIFFIPEFTMGSFLNRNRIYTAITRAKRACWIIVPNREQFNEVAVRLSPFRCDNLSKRLSSQLPNILPYSSENQQIMNEMYNDIPPDFFDTGYDSDDY